MRKILFIARRDLLYHLRKKDFYWATFGVPLLGLLLALGARALGGDPSGGGAVSRLNPVISEPHAVGYVDQAGAIADPTAVISGTSFRAFADLPAGESALRDESISSLFLIPGDYAASGVVTRTTRSASLFGGSDVDAFSALLIRNAMRTPDPQLAQRFVEPMELGRTTPLSPSVRVVGSLEHNTAATLVPVLLALAVYITIFMGASLLLQGIVEEKENRTLEVLMTSITPRQLLAGKIMGLGTLALLQLSVWVGLGRLVLRGGAAGSALGGLELPAVALPPGVWALTFLFFALGYLFYASLLAGIGAISPSMREISQLVILVSGPALLPVLFLPPMLNQPNGALAISFSIIPFTAPATMMMRQALTVVPWWQTALSVALMIAAIVGTLNGAARLFRATTLLAGTKISGRALWRALRS